MINFKVNNVSYQYDENDDKDLLSFLRNELHLTAAKDGCSGEGVCGACTVQINGKAKLACRTKISKLDGAEVVTLEGLEIYRKETIAKTMVNH